MFDLFLPSGKSSYLIWKSSPQNLEDNSCSRDLKLGLFELSLKLWIRKISYPSTSSESGQWIGFEMDNESLGTPTASLTSSMSSVNSWLTSDVLSDVLHAVTTFYTTAGEYIYLKLWIISTIKEKEVPTLHDHTTNI